MHVAAKYHRYDIMKTLMENKATLRPQSDKKITPMHIAAMEGYVDIMHLLINSLQNQPPRVVSYVALSTYLAAYLPASLPT